MALHHIKNTDKPYLHQQIFAILRNDILSGNLKPGTLLPTIRQTAKQWNCATGTIIRVYQELAHQGLIVSQVGRGTRVIERIPEQSANSLSRVSLFNHTQIFLNKLMIAGYSRSEVEQSLCMALDHWQAFSSNKVEKTADVF
jgi:DNA-binding transcriptional regulator YhcF (GntR family)